MTHTCDPLFQKNKYTRVHTLKCVLVPATLVGHSISLWDLKPQLCLVDVESVDEQHNRTAVSQIPISRRYRYLKQKSALRGIIPPGALRRKLSQTKHATTFPRGNRGFRDFEDSQCLYSVSTVSLQDSHHLSMSTGDGERGGCSILKTRHILVSAHVLVRENILV